MKVRVKAFAQFREILGGENEVEVPDGSGAVEILHRMGELSKPALETLFDADNRLRPHVIVMVNGKRMKAGEKTPLADGDEIAVFPPVAGG